MKKLLTILAIASAATFVHAQGLVYMLGGEQISTNSAISIYNNPAGTGQGGVGALTPASSSGQLYDYALLYSSAATAPSLTASSLTSTWSFTGVTATSFILPGSLASAGGAAGAATTDGWASGVSGDVVVVGWSANLGANWATVATELSSGDWAANGFFGVSGVGVVKAGGGNTPAASVFGGTGIPAGFALYSVTPVPEPTTIALIGLGGLGLAMIRRRK